MERLSQLWELVPDVWQRFVSGDLPSWIAVGIAVAAVIFALRRPQNYTELGNVRIDSDDEGVTKVTADLTTASHAANLNVIARLKVRGVSVPLTLEPIVPRINSDYRAVNTFALVFSGVYPKGKERPKTAGSVQLSIKARMSDGSSAKYRHRWPITPDGQQPSLGKGDSPTE